MRLSLAFGAGLERPASCLLLHPDQEFDAAGTSCDVVQPFRPAFESWERRAKSVSPSVPNGSWDMAVVCVTRSKLQTQDLIAQAARQAKIVVVDGQKTDGIESHYKALRKRVDVNGTITKSHGRLFWFDAVALDDWSALPVDVEGFETRPGVFSSDGPDPASQALVAALPDQLKGKGADLGAGWGYLSNAALGRGCAALDLVEADHLALECARQNIDDDRAGFHWSDATRWSGAYDFIVMNPPFHRGRVGDPKLGQDFIRTAAKCLKPRGTLWMVANAHLPYEATLENCFSKVELRSADRRFKIFEASRPRR